MNKLLFITHYYPPYGGVGVVRIANFVKHLPEYGWEPIVLTTEIGDEMPFRDFGLWDEVKDCARVIRTGISRLPFINSENIKWIPILLRRAVKACKDENVDAVLISGGPFFSFLAGYACRRLLKIPYVLDYRDGWTVHSNFHSTSLRGRIGVWLSGIIEKPIIGRASAIITASPSQKAEYEKHFGALLKNKSYLVTNGYDGEIETVPPASKKPAGKPIEIVYTGTVHNNCPVKELVDALEILMAAREGLSEKVKIVFIGHVYEENKALLDKPAIRDIIEYKGFMAHSLCIDYCSKNADILLSMDNTYAMPTKLYYYLAIKKPIIILEPPGGPFKQLIGNLSRGITIADCSDPSSIVQSFEMMLAARDAPEISTEFIERFSRKNLTKELSRILNKVAKA